MKKAIQQQDRNELQKMIEIADGLASTCAYLGAECSQVEVLQGALSGIAFLHQSISLKLTEIVKRDSEKE